MKSFVVSLVLAASFMARMVWAQDGTDLSAGGLAPPPAIERAPEAAPPTPTEQELERADREDAGRGLSFVWLNADGGYQLLGLQTFSGDDLVDGAAVKSTYHGPAFGAGLGARLIFITIGARFRYALLQDARFWSINLEGGFRIPLGRLEPYFTFGGGYAALGGFDSGGALEALGGADGDLSVRGFGLRGGAGIDYFVGRSLSVGANLSGDLLFLSRSSVSGVEQGVYARDGSGIGGATTLLATVGLHL